MAYTLFLFFKIIKMENYWVSCLEIEFGGTFTVVERLLYYLVRFFINSAKRKYFTSLLGDQFLSYTFYASFWKPYFFLYEPEIHLKKHLYTYLKVRVREKEWLRERGSCPCWLIPQMSATARARLEWSQWSGIHSGIP